RGRQIRRQLKPPHRFSPRRPFSTEPACPHAGSSSLSRLLSLGASVLRSQTLPSPPDALTLSVSPSLRLSVSPPLRLFPLTPDTARAAAPPAPPPAPPAPPPSAGSPSRPSPPPAAAAPPSP